MTSEPMVSAVVCTYDRPDMMKGCLESLARALRADDEIVVVEAGDSAVESAIESVRCDQTVVHLRARRPGKSRQLNVGIARAAGRLLLLTDDDVRLDPAWRDAMVACFADPEVGMVCGRVDGLHYGPTTPAGGAEGEPFDAPFETWTYAHGALMAVRATAAWHSGGFDERLGPGAPAHGEEHDLLLRLRRRGWTVRIVPAAPAQHVEWRDAAARRRNALVYERGAGAFVGAALRRSGHDGLAVLSRRLAHQGWLLTVDWKLGIRALPAFAGGLAYGLRLRERPWLRPGGGREGQ